MNKKEFDFILPEEALKEALVNAIIPKDYFETGFGVNVKIFDNRVEIINPGKFPKGVSPKKPLHKPVNRILSQYMYDIGFVEKYGSGIIFVRKLLNDNGNNKITIPEIASRLHVNEKTVKRDINQLKDKEILKRVGPDKGGYWEIFGGFPKSLP